MLEGEFTPGTDAYADACQEERGRQIGPRARLLELLRDYLPVDAADHSSEHLDCPASDQLPTDAEPTS